LGNQGLFFGLNSVSEVTRETSLCIIEIDE